MRLSEIQVGSVLCDMHDGLKPRITEPFLVAEHKRIRGSEGARYIEEELTRKLGRRYLYANKLLVVTDVKPADEKNEPGQVYAVYSYDSLLLGSVRLVVWPTQLVKDNYQIKPKPAKVQ